ncbi:MAG: flagellar assembly protein T N-terminal domain-containing protein [Nitrospirota bacterium]
MGRANTILLRLLTLIISILTIGFLFAGLLYASTEERIEVEGHAAIVAGKKDLARDKAINDAFRRAVEQVVGVMVEAETLVKNLELLTDRIYSQTTGYIKNYKIIEERIEGDVMKVRIEAVVAISSLEKELDAIGILMKRVEKPRILLLISEQNITHDRPSYWWGSGDTISIGVVENTLLTKFMEKGFNFVDRQVILQSIKDDPSIAHNISDSLSNEMALKLASEGEAEVVIIGQAVAKAGPVLLETTMRSCQANISTRVLNADNGEILASFTANAVVAHVDPITGGTEALKKASNDMADRLISQVIAKWQKQVGGARTIRLIISGLDFDKVIDFREFLRDHVRGIVDIYERSFKDDIAKLDIEAKSSAKEIAEELSNKGFNNGVIEVTSFTGNVIKIRFILSKQ